MKHHYRFTRPSIAIRRARLDNAALVPASLLPYRATWQKIANNLPRGAVLVVLPPLSARQRSAYEAAAQSLRALGRHVRTIGVDQLHVIKE